MLHICRAEYSRVCYTYAGLDIPEYATHMQGWISQNSLEYAKHMQGWISQNIPEYATHMQGCISQNIPEYATNMQDRIFHSKPHKYRAMYIVGVSEYATNIKSTHAAQTP